MWRNPSKYTFRESCEEMPELKLRDGTRKIFYNCRYRGEDLPEELQKLYEGMGCHTRCERRWHRRRPSGRCVISFRPELEQAWFF